LAEGSVSTTGDAELDNARTTWYGITEERAGNAIRNQAQNLILVQSGKPTGNALKGNKVWVKSSQDDIEIPDMDDIAGKQDKLIFDSVPIEDSINSVNSGGIFKALSTETDYSGRIIQDYNDNNVVIVNASKQSYSFTS